MGPPPIVLRDGSFRVYSARSAVYPLNEADIPPGGRDSASLRPLGWEKMMKYSISFHLT